MSTRARLQNANDSKSLWNYTLSPGWSEFDAFILRLAVMRYGCGAWREINKHFPNKKCNQLNLQTQRLFGQQALAEFNKVHIDPSRIKEINDKIDGFRKNTCLINEGNNLRAEEKENRRRAHIAKYGIPRELYEQIQVAVVLDPPTPCKTVLDDIEKLREMYRAVYDIQLRLKHLRMNNGNNSANIALKAKQAKGKKNKEKQQQDKEQKKEQEKDVDVEMGDNKNKNINKNENTNNEKEKDQDDDVMIIEKPEPEPKPAPEAVPEAAAASNGFGDMNMMDMDEDMALAMALSASANMKTPAIEKKNKSKANGKSTKKKNTKSAKKSAKKSGKKSAKKSGKKSAKKSAKKGGRKRKKMDGDDEEYIPGGAQPKKKRARKNKK